MALMARGTRELGTRNRGCAPAAHIPSLYQSMYPVTHMTIAVGGVWIGAGLWRRLIRRAPDAAGVTQTIDYRFAAFGALIPTSSISRWQSSGSAALRTARHRAHDRAHPARLVRDHPRRDPPRAARRFAGACPGSRLPHSPAGRSDQYVPADALLAAFGTDFPRSHQDYRSYFQIPLDILLVATYSIAVWRSERWRARALAFVRTGAFPFTNHETLDAGRDASSLSAQQRRPTGTSLP
jgi:hypothetical protein